MATSTIKSVQSPVMDRPILTIDNLHNKLEISPVLKKEDDSSEEDRSEDYSDENGVKESDSEDGVFSFGVVTYGYTDDEEDNIISDDD